MRLRPTLLALAVALAAAGTSASAQTAAPAGRPAVATQPAVRTPAAAAKAAVTPATAARPVTTAKPGTAPSAKAEPIDINTATSADLKTIPGIGDAYAAKIIASRPYHSKDELARKKILPAGVYAKVKDRIVAHQH